MSTQTLSTAPRSERPTESTLAEAYRLAILTARSVLRDDIHEGIDAQDVAQEILLRFADLDLATIRNWRAWVRTVTRRRALDVIRAERQHRHDSWHRFDSGDNPSGWAPLPRRLRVLGASAEPVSRLALRGAAAHLSDREQQVLWAHLDGWSNGEISRGLRFASAESVAVTLTRIRSKVRAAFPAGPERDLLLGETPRLY